jgi:hypothetical protein
MIASRRARLVEPQVSPAKRRANPLAAEATSLIEELDRQPKSPIRDTELDFARMLLKLSASQRLRANNPRRDELERKLTRILLRSKASPVMFPDTARRVGRIFSLIHDLTAKELAASIKKVGYDYESYEFYEHIRQALSRGFSILKLSAREVATIFVAMDDYLILEYNIDMGAADRHIYGLQRLLGITGKRKRELFARQIFEYAANAKPARRQASGAASDKRAQPPEGVALMEDKTLARLRRRYEQRLRSTELPPSGFNTIEQARAAARLVTTYHNLRTRQIERGLEPEPQDSRVVKANSLKIAFYRVRRKPGAKAEP